MSSGIKIQEVTDQPQPQAPRLLIAYEFLNVKPIKGRKIVQGVEEDHVDEGEPVIRKKNSIKSTSDKAHVDWNPDKIATSNQDTDTDADKEVPNSLNIIVLSTSG